MGTKGLWTALSEAEMEECALTMLNAAQQAGAPVTNQTLSKAAELECAQANNIQSEMSMTIHQLIERLLREPFCKLIPRGEAPRTKPGARLPLTGRVLPRLRGRRHLREPGQRRSRALRRGPSGQRLGTGRGSLRAERQRDHGGRHGPAPIEHFDDCYLLARASDDPRSIIGIDLHPQQFGWIFSHFGLGYYSFSLPAPVVARSFSEWLEKTLDEGIHKAHDERRDGDVYYHTEDDEEEQPSIVPCR